MVPSFFSLPVDIVRAVLGRWLEGDLKSICSLDCACSPSVRSKYLPVLRDAVIVDKYAAQLNGLKWITDRDVLVSHLVINIPSAFQIAGVQPVVPFRAATIIINGKDTCEFFPELTAIVLQRLLSGWRDGQALHFSGVAQLSGQHLEIIANSRIPLKELSIVECKKGAGAEKGIQRVLLALSSSLEVLRLTCFLPISKPTFDILVRECPLLEQLVVDATKVSDAQSLTELCRSKPRLIFLNFFNTVNHVVDDSDILEMLRHLPLLQNLGIAKFSKVTDASFPAIMALCPKLDIYVSEYFHLFHSGTKDFADSRKVPQELKLHDRLLDPFISLQNILPFCDRLCVLAINTNNALILGCMNVIIANIAGPQLRQLDGCFEDDIRGFHFQHFFQRFNCLTSLQLEKCNNAFDDEGVVLIAKYLVKLTVFQLRRCPKFTDKGALVLLTKCKKLGTFGVKYCPLITEITLWNLVKLHQRMDCVALTDNGLTFNNGVRNFFQVHPCVYWDECWLPFI